MNRRNFFKTVTGFVAGIFATSVVAKEKPKLTVVMPQKAKKELDAQKVYEDIMLKRAMDCFKYPAYVIHEDGSMEIIPYQDYLTIK